MKDPATTNLSALVSADWLHEQLAAQPNGLVVLDASIGADRDTAEGIPGAQRFDIDGEFSRSDSNVPHTMIPADQFQAQVRRLGVNAQTTVVVYDGAGIYSSPRAWWMFRSMGHNRVVVLDGGLPAWRAVGFAVEPFSMLTRPVGSFLAHPNPRAFVDQEQMMVLLTDPGVAVLDARSRERFEGTAPEPRPGLRGGHMPGSRSLPISDLVHEGRLLGLEALAALVSDRQRNAAHVVASCGSGVTACAIALAAHLSGVRDISVYDGSWSEWGLPGGPPVTTADTP